MIGNDIDDERLADESFSCVAEPRGGDVVVTIRGELDLATRAEAEAVLIDAEGAAGLVAAAQDALGGPPAPTPSRSPRSSGRGRIAPWCSRPSR